MSAGLQAIVDNGRRSMRRPRTCTIPQLRRKLAAGQAPPRARHRGRPHLLFRHQIFGADEGRGAPARTASSGRSMAAPTASARAGLSPPSSRPSMTRPASNGRSAVAPFKVVILNLKQGGSDTDRGLRSGFMPRSRPRASTCSTMILTSGRARNSPPPTSSAFPGRSWSGRGASPRAKSRSSAAPTGARELIPPADALARLGA